MPPSLALPILAILSLRCALRDLTWLRVSMLFLIMLELGHVEESFRVSVPWVAAAVHALWPAPFAHMVWVSCEHRGGNWIVIGYALAAVAIGASYSEAWRAPWLYEGAITATRWVAAMLVTYAWASERRRVGRPGAVPLKGDPWSLSPCLTPTRQRLEAPDASQYTSPRAVALILGGGHALGVIGAWAAANPWRDWYLARGLTWAEYAVCASVMACELRRKR